jgi:hypothetical protein
MAGLDPNLQIVSHPDGSCEVFCLQVDGEITAKIVLSADVIAKLCRPDLVYLDMSIDGLVSTRSEPEGSQLGEPLALDTLVRDAISLEMLEDEPDAEALLQVLREKLVRSLAAIETVIADLKNRS